MKNRVLFAFIVAISAIALKFLFTPFLSDPYNSSVKIFSSFSILLFGSFFVLKNSAEIIEETTDVLHERTKIAGGVLQSFGTAFPDMVLGVAAAITSLRLRDSNYAVSVSYAIIAASTTFGSNIYNIGHAIWCIYRQNLANKINKPILMFPHIKLGGTLIPFSNQKLKPTSKEFETALDTLVALTLLTAFVAISMVLFGKVDLNPTSLSGDLYQLVRPVGIAIFILASLTIYYFRESKKESSHTEDAIIEERYFRKKSSFVIWIVLLLSGVAILFSAESMVHAIQILSEITKIPVVITGVLAGVIGCLGEMIVVHNYSVHPKGKIGDAIVGVAMDNIVTILGASIVSIMGGVFLGGNALIVIFVLILALNTVLIWQIGKLKDYVLNIDKI